MDQNFVTLLEVGSKSNSLGRVDEVIALVLEDKSRLEELYECLAVEDSWVRMRAADALEKMCRVHPDWLRPYIDRLAQDFATDTQASIQWHMAQIYEQVELTGKQRDRAIEWLKRLLSTVEVDWIVAANAMDTLAKFCHDGFVPAGDLTALLNVQQRHKSKAVVRRADKYLATILVRD